MQKAAVGLGERIDLDGVRAGDGAQGVSGLDHVGAPFGRAALGLGLELGHRGGGERHLRQVRG